MDCLKTQNQCVNTIIFPGAFAHPTYTMDRYLNSLKFQLIFIPFMGDFATTLTSCMAAPTYIPALLYVNTSGKANRFCLNFHGNACDVGQIALCAEKEGKAYNAHYLIVEYPRFGVSDGHPNEVTLNAVAKCVHSYIVKEFKVDPSDIILMGRSIGTGPVCELASQLQLANTPPAAVILHSPYSSIRDITYDLVGCVNYFLLDRWENWRKLIGPDNDMSVIRCPVLFIHADGDRVININHSVLMHEYRTKCGLKSELFVQKSDSIFVKGHNYFDYERDVVLPSTDFLARHVSNNHTRLIVINKDVVRHMAAVPHPYHGKYTQEQEMQFLGSTSIYKSMKCTWDVYAGWCCCPIVSSAECCVACNANFGMYLCHNFIPGCKPMFSYQELRPAGDPNKNTLWGALFRPTEFGKSLREEEAAQSAGQRMQRHMFHQQQYTKSVFRTNSGMAANSTTNPLLAGGMLGDSTEGVQTSQGSHYRKSSGSISVSNVSVSVSSGTSTNMQDGSQQLSYSASGTSVVSDGNGETTTNTLLEAMEISQTAGLDYVPG